MKDEIAEIRLRAIFRARQHATWRTRARSVCNFTGGAVSGLVTCGMVLATISHMAGPPDFRRASLMEDEIAVLDFIFPDWESGLSSAEIRFAREVIRQVCGALEEEAKV